MIRIWLVIGATDYGINFTEVSDGMSLKKWAWFAPKFVVFRGREYTYYVRYPLTVSEAQALKFVIAYHTNSGTEVFRIEDGIKREGGRG